MKTELRIITAHQYKCFKVYDSVACQRVWAFHTLLDTTGTAEALRVAIHEKARELYNVTVSPEEEVICLHNGNNEYGLRQFELLLSRLSIPKSMRTSRSSDVTVAHLDGVFDSTVPRDIWNMCNLESLSLQYNNLSAVPPQIFLLPKLKSLNMTHNLRMDYTAFPMTMRWCKELTHLYLPNVFSLSIHLRDMPKLEYLELSNLSGTMDQCAVLLAHGAETPADIVALNHGAMPIRNALPLYLTCRNAILRGLTAPDALSHLPGSIMNDLIASSADLQMCAACPNLFVLHSNYDGINFVLPVFLGHTNKLFQATVCRNVTCSNIALTRAKTEYYRIREELDREYERMVERATLDYAVIDAAEASITAVERHAKVHRRRRAKFQKFSCFGNR